MINLDIVKQYIVSMLTILKHPSFFYFDDQLKVARSHKVFCKLSRIAKTKQLLLSIIVLHCRTEMLKGTHAGRNVPVSVQLDIICTFIRVLRLS